MVLSSTAFQLVQLFTLLCGTMQKSCVSENYYADKDCIILSSHITLLVIIMDVFRCFCHDYKLCTPDQQNYMLSTICIIYTPVKQVLCYLFNARKFVDHVYLNHLIGN